VLAIVALCALATSGCAGSIAQTPAASATPGAQESATSVPVPSPSDQPSATGVPASDAVAEPLHAPEQILGGDCSALLSTADVSALLGAPVAPVTGRSMSPLHAAVAAMGGLSCLWSEGDGQNMAALSTVVEAATAYDVRGTGPVDDGVWCYGSLPAMECSFSVVSGPLWMSGHVYTAAGENEADARAAVTSLGDDFRALELAEPAREAAQATAWSLSDCSELDGTVDVGALLQSPGFRGSTSDVVPGDIDGGIYAAVDTLGVFGCDWYQQTDVPEGDLGGFSVVALPGGAWVKAQALAWPGATEIDLPGVELAVLVPWDPAVPDQESLNVFDGVNWLQVTSRQDVMATVPVIPTLVAALNGL
jgi:hypothetical protein